jgi:RHS repeat-associated protein
LGSTRVIVDNAGNITAQYNYYPFGKQWEDANLMANTNRWNFSGKEKQTIRDLGWLDFSARMYANCEMPIFITQDPLAEKYYSISPYAYCANNPIRYIDPDGREIRFTYEWEKDKNGNYVINANGGYNLTGVTMHVTGKTINVSSNKSINMEKVTQRIADRIESSFSGKTDGVTFTTNVNLSIANSMDDVSASDHIFALADISDYQGNSVSGAANDFNGKVAFIDADYFSGLWDNSIGNTGTSTAGHEFGHLAGLKHSSDYFNIMRQGAGNSWFSLSTNVNGEQLSQIRKNYENGLLNRGSNYEFIRKVSPSSPGGMKTIKMPNRGLVRYLINY